MPGQTADMTARLQSHQYGKAETRVVRIVRDTPRHEIRDLNVSSALRGDFEAAYLTGDQSAVLPTDTQKNMVFAYAKEHGVESPERFGILLAEHFVHDIEPVTVRASTSRSTPGCARSSTAPSTTTPGSAAARRSGPRRSRSTRARRPSSPASRT